MNRLAQLAQAVVLVALASLAAVPVHADGTTAVPISGTATYFPDWYFSLNGPTLSFNGGMLFDSTIYTYCTPGTLCNISADITNNEFCSGDPCGGSFNGQTFNWYMGTLTLEAAAFAPIPLDSSVDSFVLTAPATIYGQLFALDCPNPYNSLSCNSDPLFGFNIAATGTVTATGYTNYSSSHQDAILSPIQFSFAGTATEAPEPPGWLLSLSGLGILGWIARKRQLLRKASLGCNAF